MKKESNNFLNKNKGYKDNFFSSLKCHSTKIIEMFCKHKKSYRNWKDSTLDLSNSVLILSRQTLNIYLNCSSKTNKVALSRVKIKNLRNS